MSVATLDPEPAHAVAETLRRLTPVGLDELVDRAALLTRVDRKYVVAVQDLPALLEYLPDDTHVLEIGDARAFGYRSTYLDTPERASYLLAGRRHRRRFKVRTRAYLDTDTCWLEVKTRSARDATVKQRITHHDAGDGPLTTEGLAFVDACLEEARVEAACAADLAPVLVTAYRRATLLLPSSGSRVTIDTDLGWTSLTSTPRDLDRPALAIVETKTGSTPSAVDRLLWSRGHRPVQVSKYGVGMAALDPVLPRLKWHRVLDRRLHVPRRHASHPHAPASASASSPTPPRRSPR